MARSYTQLSRLRVSIPLLVSPRALLESSHGLVCIQRPSVAVNRCKKRLMSSARDHDSCPAVRFQPAHRLAGRTCLITGGTSGIGYAIAERFLQEGASTIILVGRSHERLVDAAARLNDYATTKTNSNETRCDDAAVAPEEDRQTRTDSKIPEKIHILVGDVSNASTWTRELEKELAEVDILVNAAGISISNILPRCEVDDIAKILRTNLEGAILTSRAFMRAAIRSRIRNRNDPATGNRPLSKCIINISSLLALKAGTGAVPYAASKAGLLGLTRSLAVEASASLKDVVVRSNAVVPGYIDTPMIADFTPGEIGRLKHMIPLHRLGDPREVADAAVFLAQNEYANNCVLNLDGGLSAV